MKSFSYTSSVSICVLLLLTASNKNFKLLTLGNWNIECRNENAPAYSTSEEPDNCVNLLLDTPYSHQITEDLRPFALGINASLIQRALDAISNRECIMIYIRENRFFIERNHAATLDDRWKGMFVETTSLQCSLCALKATMQDTL